MWTTAVYGYEDDGMEHWSDDDGADDADMRAAAKRIKLSGANGAAARRKSSAPVMPQQRVHDAFLGGGKLAAGANTAARTSAAPITHLLSELDAELSATADTDTLTDQTTTNISLFGNDGAVIDRIERDYDMKRPMIQPTRTRTDDAAMKAPPPMSFPLDFDDGITDEIQQDAQADTADTAVTTTSTSTSTTPAAQSRCRRAVDVRTHGGWSDEERHFVVKFRFSIRCAGAV